MDDRPGVAHQFAGELGADVGGEELGRLDLLDDGQRFGLGSRPCGVVALEAEEDEETQQDGEPRGEDPEDAGGAVAVGEVAAFRRPAANGEHGGDGNRRRRHHDQGGPDDVHRIAARGARQASSLAFCCSNSASVMTPWAFKVGELGQLVGGPAASCRRRLAGRRSGMPASWAWASCDVVFGHLVATGDEVDEHAEERHDDHEDHPQRLGPAAQVVAAEDVGDHPEQHHDPGDPEEPDQHRPEHAEQRIVVTEHGHLL